ncbi:hypothetical protein D1818_10995 [Aquimarina sp. BL5]|uniref:hypothetical protein n=1 Tax=Aquimarina sp. BL5 TaxID=1714860 RepID=UPI000E54AD4D|nr:hypothetical protein [Aquimarina sp. BL5]AXT51332.1 hypothetical protein D1818_10995 [Aquimarina sp. BL5]RKN09878.1 hypothetical protein D7036_03655 [Aquimarina sp. BL5]
MELHRLDGFDATGLDSLDISSIQSSSEIINGVSDSAPEIAYEILDDDGNVVMYADLDENIYVIDGLGGFFKKIGKGLKKFGKKVIKPVVKTFNRFLNPATILLRNGFLLAMKINMFKVAEKLRYGYLSEAEARKRGGDMRKFAKMRKAISKAEKIYDMAGGKVKNLKKAILKGKGNKDKQVPLSGYALGNPFDDGEPDVFNDPFEKFVVESDPDVVEAFLNNEIQIEGLGAIATSASIAAATSAVAGVAALVGKIGNIFTKGKEVKEQAESLFKKPKQVSPVRFGDPRQQQFPVHNFGPAFPGRPVNQQMIQNKALPQNTNTNTPAKESFFKKHKTPILIGAGILVVGTGVAIAMRSGKKKTTRTISGTPKRRSQRGRQKTTSRDALGRFTKGSGTRRGRKKDPTRKAPEKLVPKALL